MDFGLGLVGIGRKFVRWICPAQRDGRRMSMGFHEGITSIGPHEGISLSKWHKFNDNKWHFISVYSDGQTENTRAYVDGCRAN